MKLCELSIMLWHGNWDSWSTGWVCGEENRTSLVAQTVKHLSTMWETRVRSLGREDPLEKEMAIHSSTLLPGKSHGQRSLVGLQSMGLQRVKHDWATSLTLCVVHNYPLSLEHFQSLVPPVCSVTPKLGPTLISWPKTSRGPLAQLSNVSPLPQLVHLPTL